ncbi:MAG: hypothetical protein J6S67_24410 [Methanobrevibacter sp.]|nr:hypothetical protein [Methanobrevibacter sp.]
MAKNVYTEQKVIKLVGNLDKDENGNFICTVEDKDRVQEYNVIEILEQMVGTEISLSSVNELA